MRWFKTKEGPLEDAELAACLEEDGLVPDFVADARRWKNERDALTAERDAASKRAEEAEAKLAALREKLSAAGLFREVGCLCTYEAGDSPCPVHGDES